MLLNVIQTHKWISKNLLRIIQWILNIGGLICFSFKNVNYCQFVILENREFQILGDDDWCLFLSSICIIVTLSYLKMDTIKIFITLFEVWERHHGLIWEVNNLILPLVYLLCEIIYHFMPNFWNKNPKETLIIFTHNPIPYIVTMKTFIIILRMAYLAYRHRHKSMKT